MTLKRVVVTGLGALTPIGNTAPTFWENLLKGTSGANLITRFDTTNFKTKFACEIKGFDPLQFIEKKELNRLDLYAQYALACAQEAVLDSGIHAPEINKERIGVIWSSGIGGLQTLEKEFGNYYKDDSKTPRFSPFFIPKMIADMGAGNISLKYGFMGPNYAPVAACASSTIAIIDAFNLIRLGKATAIVAGGSEAPILETGVGGFNSMKALSERNDDFASASRPFDATRDGFVMGEGAGALILEEYEHAIKRGAKIYAEVLGGAMTADAYHLTAPHPEGLGAKKVMQFTLEDAEISTDKIDYINVHGTSTPLGDVAELKAIVDLFGETAYKMNISSTKSMTGHLLGAAGAIEAIACIYSVQNDIVPPTINHSTVDENIDSRLNLTLGVSQKRTVNYALSNTFGFGGKNASVVVKKYTA